MSEEKEVPEFFDLFAELKKQKEREEEEERRRTRHQVNVSVGTRYNRLYLKINLNRDLLEDAGMRIGEYARVLSDGEKFELWQDDAGHGFVIKQAPGKNNYATLDFEIADEAKGLFELCKDKVQGEPDANQKVVRFCLGLEDEED